MEVPATAAADGQEAVMINENPDQSLAVQDDVLSAVVTGEVLPLKEVKDPVFSTE